MEVASIDSQALHTHVLPTMESWAGLGNEGRTAVGSVSHSQTGETTVGYT